MGKGLLPLEVRLLDDLDSAELDSAGLNSAGLDSPGLCPRSPLDCGENGHRGEENWFLRPALMRSLPYLRLNEVIPRTSWTLALILWNWYLQTQISREKLYTNTCECYIYHMPGCSNDGLIIRWGPNKVSGIRSPRVSPQTRASAFLVVFLLLWNDVRL